MRMSALSLVACAVALAACGFAPRESLLSPPDGPASDSRTDAAPPIDAASPDAPPIDGSSIDAMLPAPPILTIGSAAPACDSFNTGGPNFAMPTFTWTGSASDGGPVSFTCASGDGSAAPSPLPAGSPCTSGATFGDYYQGDHWVVITATDDMGSSTSYEDDFTVDRSGPLIQLILICGTASANLSWSYTLVGSHCPAVSGEWTYYKAGGGGVPAGSGDALAGSSVAIPVLPTEAEVEIDDPGVHADTGLQVCEPE